MAAASEIEEPPVLLGGNPRNQNPLKLLELLVKGFCPTVMVDRVEFNDLPDVVYAPPPLQVIGRASSDTSSPPRHSAAKPKTKKPTKDDGAKKRTRTPSKTEESLDTAEKPFEIGERPPLDVIGISKKIWEGFCYNDNKRDPLRKGFCKIVFSDDSVPPDGEECSVETATTVDLSPQSSPRSSSLPQQSSLSFEDDDLELLDYDEEEEPLAVFENKRSYRATHVFLMTLLALYATLTLLRNTTGDTHLLLESKPNTPRPFTFAVRPR